VAAVSELVRIRILRKGFPAVAGRAATIVLEGIDLGIEAGSFVVLTGPSGCGKSTLLNIVAGLDTDFEGSVDFGAADRSLAYVFQSPRLLPWRTVAENVALALPDGDPRLASVPEMLARVGLAEAASAYPERISLGMQRRAALARAFILEPDVLLMDEPFVSLDEATAEDLRKLLMELWGRRPTTVLFVTHDRREAVMLATRIVRLAGSPARVTADTAVALARTERSCTDRVTAEQRRVFADP
jgi:NitT/TauT family transport system ATP-binding protein